MSVANVKRLWSAISLPPVPSRRFVELLRQLASVFDQRVDDRLGIFSGDFHQHHIARMTLDKGRNLAVLASEQQVTFQ